MLPWLIGITGHMGSGKNAVGKFLEEDGYKCVALADKVREMAIVINPILSDNIRLEQLVDNVGWDNAKKNPEVRRLLQVIGTDAIRNMVNQDAWINMLDAQIDQIGLKRYAVTDVRFANECRWIQRRSGIVVRVMRNGFYGNQHTSENQIDTLRSDFVIVNNGTLEELGMNVKKLMNELGGNKWN